MDAVEDVEHLVAAAGVGFVVEVAEEDDDDVVGGAVEEQVLEAVPEAAVVDQLAVRWTLLDAIAVAVDAGRKFAAVQLEIHLQFAIRS